MIKYIATIGSTHKLKIKMADLVSSSIEEIVKEKWPDGKVTDITGDTASVMVGESKEIMVDPAELIESTARDIIKKKLKTRKKFTIEVGK